MPKKEGVIEIEGTIVEALPNAMFRVELSNGQKALAHIRDKVPQHYIQIFSQAGVVVALSLYHQPRCHILYGHKSPSPLRGGARRDT